ncbi:general odorant-binding protein 84a isoform X2 [Drosophila virilis]|uniref:Odorant-binding protein 84a, isoform B n=1 Tax=Drosophila virilis TaxID=7244 RepID=A0A0Q9WEW8_DROVI|nr:general odorant-binding protein 84a isoform X2 [Drosophila virilis]KRF78912.1 Odorant-binding protein 84a, isoform B [Drosophila virilis]
MSRLHLLRILLIYGLYLIEARAQDLQPEPDSPEVQRAFHAHFLEVRTACAEEFLLPYANVLQFNTTGKLFDEKDMTSMCYFRCFFEKAGIIENFKLNPDVVRKYMWPATGDSIEFCESQAMDEQNACVRTYTIAQCAMMRALTDARNTPMV